MTFIYLLNYIRCYFFYFYLTVLHYFKREPVKIEGFLDEENRYTQPLKTRFLNTFQSDVQYNENIIPLFYDKEKYKTYMMDPDTELEKVWKSRVLFENTPRGNIVLFYDAYKLGFSYYCDQKSVSYDILNAAAMKYVSLYRCRDFFMDENVVPKEHRSGLIKIHLEEERKEPVRPKARLTLNDCVKNKFLYLGRISHYSWIQNVPKKRRVLARFKSPLLESIKSDSTQETISYRDYKSAMARPSER